MKIFLCSCSDCAIATVYNDVQYPTLKLGDRVGICIAKERCYGDIVVRKVFNEK